LLTEIVLGFRDTLQLPKGVRFALVTMNPDTIASSQNDEAVH
jgi:hypothetical protein